MALFRISGGLSIQGLVTFREKDEMGPLLHVVDQKSAGTASGGIVSGSWQTRDLTTAAIDEISGGSLATNQVTLPAGTYFSMWSAPAHKVERHQTRLRDVTNNITLGIGRAAYSSNAYTHNTESAGMAKFTLSGETTIELQHRVEATYTTDSRGRGVEVNLGEDEIFGQILFEKV